MIPWAQTFGEGVRAPWTPRRETAPTRPTCCCSRSTGGPTRTGRCCASGRRSPRPATRVIAPNLGYVRTWLRIEPLIDTAERVVGGGAGGASGGTSPGGRPLDGRADLDRAAGAPPGVAGPDRPAGVDRVSGRRRRAGAHPRPVRADSSPATCASTAAPWPRRWPAMSRPCRSSAICSGSMTGRSRTSRRGYGTRPSC